MLAKSDHPTEVDPAKAIATALDAVIPKAVRALETQLRDMREARAELAQKLNAVIADRLAGKSGFGDDQVRQAKRDLDEMDDPIGVAMRKLSAAREEFAPEYRAATIKLLANLGQNLAQAVALIEHARGHFAGVHRHASRHGMTAPDFIFALPPTDRLKACAARLVK